MIFHSKPRRIDAELFSDVTRPPRGVHGQADGTFYVVTIQNRVTVVGLGEWIVDEGDGKHFYPITDAKLKECYSSL